MNRTIVTITRFDMEAPIVLVNRTRKGKKVCRAHNSVTEASGQRLFDLVMRTESERSVGKHYLDGGETIIMKFKLEV